MDGCRGAMMLSWRGHVPVLTARRVKNSAILYEFCPSLKSISRSPMALKAGSRPASPKAATAAAAIMSAIWFGESRRQRKNSTFCAPRSKKGGRPASATGRLRILSLIGGNGTA